MNKRSLFSRLLNFILVVSVLFSSASSWAEVKAYLNQSNYYEGNPITLTVKTNTNNNTQPDLSVLDKNFEQLGISTSSQINIINGRRTFNKSWTIELQPKLKGKIEIPEIHVGSEKTEALELIISDLPPELKIETSQHIFIESSINTAGGEGQAKNQGETYVQQQIPYTVKLFYDSTMMSGDISPLDVKNAVVEQLGRDKRYHITRGGKKFNVLEKNYVISPEKSGLLQIPATEVKGRIALSGGDSPALRRRMDETDMLNRFFNDFRNDPFLNDPFAGFFSKRKQGPSKPFTVSSDPIEVNVLSVPKKFKAAMWLPAEDLELGDVWELQPPELKVGEPATRIILIRATGLAGSQIPERVIQKPKNTKVYPEPAQSETKTNGKTVIGIQQQNITYIPSKAGKIVLPEIKVEWWNTKKKRQEVTTLAALTFTVAPGIQGVIPDYEGEVEVANENVEKPLIGATNNVVPKKGYWKTYLFYILIFVIGLLFSRWLFTRVKKYKVEIGHTLSKQDGVNAYKLRAPLLAACEHNNNEESASLVISFAQAVLQDSSIQNLGILATKLQEGGEVIKELEKSLYSSNKTQWKGASLLALVNAGFQIKGRNALANKHDSLKPLYPI